MLIGKKQSYKPKVGEEYWKITLTMEKVKQSPSLIYGKKGMAIDLDEHVTRVYINQFKENAIDELIEELKSDNQ